MNTVLNDTFTLELRYGESALKILSISVLDMLPWNCYP